MIAVMAGGLLTPHAEDAYATELPNQAYRVAIGMREKGRYVPLPDENIRPWRFTCDGYIVPRYAKTSATVVDETVLPEAEELGAHPGLTLRPYQRTALAAWWRRKNGIIVAPCGAGKTAIGLTAVLHIATPALVLVHTHDLLRQWQARAHAIGIPVQVIADGAPPTVSRLVVATMQTLATWSRKTLDSWGESFGLVVVDEAHHVPCATLTDVLYSLPGRYRLALTATPERADGLTPILLSHMGPVRAEVSRAALIEANAIIVPEVRRISTGWAPKEDCDYTEMVTASTESAKRNGLIVALASAAVAEGRTVLIQTERVEHVEQLGRMLQGMGVGSAAVHGRLHPKVRAALLESVASGRTPVLIATQLADEGLDLPKLDTLILGVPQRNAARLEQRVGRIARPAPGKLGAVVYDLCDGGKAERLWYQRRKVYRMMGCPVVEA
ncbi:DEAD/DEAH box helicase [Janthinobacterium sp.]|uniref:DEAD/DEAH box helicase n=1 Tax=Janthinobacterium sp. TaxID=1871054 RepID=UPI0025BD6524|nr:DEAD/DEAH box helicase [Janthinobacterium sp.]NBV20262.1 DEAD/DEAH box helicase [Janthinobacterium sp.]